MVWPIAGRRSNKMSRDGYPPVEDSREGGRVWLLAVILAAMGLTLVSSVIYTIMAASAAFFAHRIVQG